MTTFTTADRLEEEDYLRKQLQIQQNEIDRLNGLVMQLKKEIKFLKDDDIDMDGRC
jgi:hypothetical protein